WTIPGEAPGGEYTLEVREANGKFLALERKFIVNKYQIPRLNKELEFSKKSYGPGEEVAAACKVARAEGGKPVANAKVDVTVLVDGQEYGKDGKLGKPFSLKTDAQGGVLVKFKLPKAIQRGAATLSVTFHDGDVDTIVRPIPIVLDKLQVEFYPEGGDLVAGVPNRIYFQVRNTLGKPAELKGRIVDDKGQVLADVETFSDPKHPGANHGVGVFKLSPVENGKYELKIDEPVGIKSTHSLPAVKGDGLVLSLPQGVVSAGQPLVAEVRSGKFDRNVLVGAYCRGQLMAHERVHVKKGQTTRVTLKPGTSAGGVYRVTVFEEMSENAGRPTLVPRAERLTYREPTESLKLKIKPEKDQYFPGDKVKLTCQAVDEQGQSAPAIVMLAVVDKSVLKLADEKTYRSMPTHFLLTTEVKKPEDLEHADFLLTDHASARIALDMLLGTQGWRRFAEQKLPEEFRNKPAAPQSDVDRLLVMSGRLKPDTLKQETKDADRLILNQIADKYMTKIQAKKDDLLALDVQRVQAVEETERRKTELLAERDEANADYRAALASLSSYENLGGGLRKLMLPALIVVLLLVAGVAVARGASQLKQQASHAMPYMAMAACCVMLVAVVGALQFQGGNQGAFNEVARTLNEELGVPADKVAQAMPEMDAMPLEERKARGAADAHDDRLKKFDRNNNNIRPREDGKGVPPPAAQPAAFNGPVPKPQAGLAGADQPRRRAEQLEKKFKNIDEAEKQLGQAKGEGKGPGVMFRDMDKAKEAKDAAGWRANNFRERAEMERAARGLMMQNRQQDALDAQLRQMLAEPGKAQFAGGRAPASPLLLEALQRAREVNAEPMAPPIAPFVVREYAHVHPTSVDNVRTDFTETVLWQPVLVLPGGKAEAVFDLNDSVTTFQVLAAGHTLDGRLGEVTYDLESRLPLVLDPKIPLEVTATDTLAIPVSIANNTDKDADLDIVISPSRLSLLGGVGRETLSVGAQKRDRRIYSFKPQIVEGEVALLVDGQGKNIRGDRIERTIKVVPDGFPVMGAKSDLLEGSAQHDLVLPATWIKGTLKYEVAVYPSTLADLQKGLEAMLREPHGCFEQTSTTNYPNLLILDYLKTTDQADPAVARRAQELIDKGYKRLTSFECKKRSGGNKEGYEWFGGFAPPHEALTAYGLMQFRDMAAVYDVDQAMVDRTRDYLLARRDGKGGFERNRKALDTFGRAPENITNAYIVYALTESSKTDDIAKELEALVKEAKTSKDPYFLALVANSLINRNRTAEGIDLLKKIAELQKPDG
ncbi:MAG: alpha-2-macroglobulin family protein, partial [Gemmataceae bacterium]